MLEIFTYPHPNLKIKCEPITEFGSHLLPVVNDMIVTMIGNRGIGLAANQVGLTKRIFVMNVGNSMKEYINPEIVEFHDEVKNQEGCLSFPGVYANVKRHGRIKIKAMTLMGNIIEEELTGIDAICFQHELDHLNGITFYDHLSPLQRNILQRKMTKIQKENRRNSS